MPSIETDVASVVRQDNCTWSPAEITLGVAVSCAVGAAAVAGGGAACAGGNGFCFLQPENVTKATSNKAGTKIRFTFFNVVLPSRKFRFQFSAIRSYLSSYAPCSHSSFYWQSQFDQTCIQSLSPPAITAAHLLRPHRTSCRPGTTQLQRGAGSPRIWLMIKIIDHHLKAATKIVRRTVMTRTDLGKGRHLLPTPIWHQLSPVFVSCC